jgi:hypothetical protein
VPDGAGKSLRISKRNVGFDVTEKGLPGSDLELYRPQVRQLPVWGRCYKRNWGKMTPLAGGASSANWQLGDDATNGTGAK